MCTWQAVWLPERGGEHVPAPPELVGCRVAPQPEHKRGAAPGIDYRPPLANWLCQKGVHGVQLHDDVEASVYTQRRACVGVLLGVQVVQGHRAWSIACRWVASLQACGC